MLWCRQRFCVHINAWRHNQAYFCRSCFQPLFQHHLLLLTLLTMCLPATSWKHTQTSLKPSDLECMHIRHRLTCKLCEMNEALTWVKISIRLPNWTSDKLCALHFLHLPPYLFFFLSFFFFPGHVVRYTQSSHFLLSTSFMCESYLNCSTNGGIFLAKFCFLSFFLCLSDLVEVRPFECRSLKKL